MILATAMALVAVSIVVAIAVGCVLLHRAFARPKLLPEEIALAGAWVFVVGGMIWLAAFLGGATFLGFDEPWTWLAAAHFLAAGFGALTITALTCRVVADQRALTILRVLLVAHPVAYLVTAAGISGLPYCDELGATSYQLIFIIQLVAFLRGQPVHIHRRPRILVGVALAVPVGTLIPALAWAWGHPILDLEGMAWFHGLTNAIGHVGFGLIAFAWGRPRAHSLIDDRLG